jgi:hypothetical protein
MPESTVSPSQGLRSWLQDIRKTIMVTSIDLEKVKKATLFAVVPLSLSYFALWDR